MHCGRFFKRSFTRREMLQRCANGFGLVALASLWTEEGRANDVNPCHHAPKVRNVIFLYMDGGPSQIDTFDYKPMLEKYHGRDPHSIFRVEPTQFDNVGKVLASPWKFKQRGQSGLWVSDLLPYMAECADDLAVVRTVVSNFSEHTTANYFLHTGSGQQGRPSMGAWASYGLGSENRNLPGFIVLNGGLIPPGGLDNFNSGFLPRRIKVQSSGLPIRPWPTFARWSLRRSCRRTSSLFWGSSTNPPGSALAAATRLNRPLPITKLPSACKPRFRS
jgi:hypothetical protein